MLAIEHLMPALKEPVLQVTFENLTKLTNSNEIGEVWSIFTRAKESLQDGRRLENMSWRLWYRSQHSNGKETQFEVLAKPLVKDFPIRKKVADSVAPVIHEIPPNTQLHSVVSLMPQNEIALKKSVNLVPLATQSAQRTNASSKTSSGKHHKPKRVVSPHPRRETSTVEEGPRTPESQEFQTRKNNQPTSVGDKRLAPKKNEKSAFLVEREDAILDPADRPKFFVAGSFEANSDSDFSDYESEISDTDSFLDSPFFYKISQPVSLHLICRRSLLSARLLHECLQPISDEVSEPISESLKSQLKSDLYPRPFINSDSRPAPFEDVFPPASILW